MKKMIVFAFLMVFVMPLAVMPVFAAVKTVDAGNKLCPISGHLVSGTSFVEYQGKRYGLCCPMCKTAFLKDPEKYLLQMNAREKAFALAAATPDVLNSGKVKKGVGQGSF